MQAESGEIKVAQSGVNRIRLGLVNYSYDNVIEKDIESWYPVPDLPVP